MVELAERLIGKGFDSDPRRQCGMSRLIGANRAFIEERLPHIGDLLTDDIAEVLEHGDVLIAGSRVAEVADAIAARKPHQFVIDLVRLPDSEQLRGTANYRGIGW